MIASKDLFQLIKSLSSSEKIHFKRHSLVKSDRNKNYILLFQAIDKQEIYDETAIRQQFHHHRFAKQFPVAKSYLYDRILDSLDSFHTSIYEQIRHLLHSSEILFNRNLFHQSIKKILKAKAIALKHDIYHMLPEICFWENKIALNQQDAKKLDDLLGESSNYLKLLQNIQAYQALSYKSGLLILKLGLKDPGTLREIKKIFSNPLLKSEKLALTFSAKRLFLSAHSTYKFASGDYGGTAAYLKENIELFETNTDKIENDYFSYIATISNYIQVLIEINQFSEAELYLEKYHNLLLKKRDKKHFTYSLTAYYGNYTMCLMKSGRFNLTARILPQILVDYKKHKDDFTNEQHATILGSISVLYFMAEEYNKSLQFLNIIRNIPNSTLTPDMESLFRILYIIVHFELKHYELIPSLALSAYRYFYKKQNLSRLENIILQFFRKNVKIDSRKEFNQVLSDLKDQMLALQDNPLEKRSFIFFNYVAWLESKINNKSFAETIRKGLS